jgi:hypothetical protein
VWSYIQTDNVEKFIDKYPQLAEGFGEICLYQTDDKVFVPRLFNKNFKEFVETFESTKKPFTQTFFKFTGTLRSEQTDIVNSVLDQYVKNGKQINGIIKARPGLG